MLAKFVNMLDPHDDHSSTLEEQVVEPPPADITNTDDNAHHGPSGPSVLHLPAASVSRILRSSIPSEVRLNRQATTALGRCGSLFALYLATCAAENAAAAHRKTIDGKDVMKALLEGGFGTILEHLESDPSLIVLGKRHGRRQDPNTNEFETLTEQDRDLAPKEIHDRDGNSNLDELLAALDE
eukprot:GHVT01084329.1.p3 GENE.GHVT01084329.1~~GHVT01084329.1.p3  ORF type:complete len:183 (-),score=22.15 GHVT01084329.1:492-1040(-)